LRNRAGVLILESSGRMYFDSLTGITKNESGEFSDKLKIMGKPELYQQKARERRKRVLIKNRHYLETVNFYGDWRRRIVARSSRKPARAKGSAGRSSYKNLKLYERLRPVIE